MNLLKLFFGNKRVLPSRGSLSSLDRQQIDQAWVKIETLSRVGKPSAWREAVIEADKLVDFVLKRRFPGRETAGERLKEAKTLFSDRGLYENLWYAHKLRNELVHTVGFELPSTEAKNLLEYFKRALEVLT